jgi:competence protein ComEC
LLPVVVTVWLTDGFLLGSTGTGAGKVGVAKAGLTVVIAGGGLAAAGMMLRGRGRVVLAGSLLLVGLSAIVAGLVCVPRAMQLADEPWQGWGERRARIVVEATLQTSPRLLPDSAGWQRSGADAGAGAEGLGRASAVVDRAVDHDNGYELHAPADVVIPVADVEVGDTVAFAARVAAGRPGRAATLTAVGPVRVVRAGVTPGGWLRGRFRASLGDVPVVRRELVLGMVLGDDSRLPPETAEELRTVGLSHLTAVSGANIAIVAAIAALLGRVVLASRRSVIALVAVGIVVYVALVGLEPSVLRAAVMAGVALIGVMVGGGSGISALLFSAAVLLILDPYLSLSRGFALSCAATVGLVVAAPIAARVGSKLRRRLPLVLAAPAVSVVALVVMTVSAQVSTAPLLVSYGQGLSLISAASNLLAAPAVPIVTTVGLALAALAAVGPAAAAALSDAVDLPARWILWVAEVAVAAPVSSVAVTDGLVVTGLVTALACAMLFAMRRHPRAGVGFAVAIVVTSLVAVRPPVPLGARAPRDWLAIFCDVGQGDAALLRTGPESGVLIDSAPDPVAARRCLSFSGISRLEALVVSHYHRDHVGGVSALLERWRPATALGSPLAEPALTYRQTAGLLRERGVPMRVPGFAERVEVGWLSWQVLWPHTLIGGGSAPNNASLCLLAQVRFQGRSTTLLLTGDIEVEAQVALVADWSTVRVDVAKVPHHGSRRQYPGLASWARAALAVISVGRDNDYGHPADSTVESWRRAGSEVLRTDQGGHIVVTRDPGDGRLLVTRSAPTDPNMADP